MKNKILILITSLLVMGVLAACSTTPVTVTAPAEPRTLTATGTGEVYIVPDIAYINIGIHSEADTVSAALSDNNTKAQDIVDTLGAQGVDSKDIQTSNFNVYPNTAYGPDGSVTRKYYAVDNTVYVTIRDLSNMGKLLDAVVSSGANTVNSISFDVQNKDEAVAQARDLAIQKAKAEAESIAKSAGVALGEIQTISTSSSNVGTMMYADVKAVGGGGAVPVSAGQLSISIDANITYLIK